MSLEDEKNVTLEFDGGTYGSFQINITEYEHRIFVEWLGNVTDEYSASAREHERSSILRRLNERCNYYQLAKTPEELGRPVNGNWWGIREAISIIRGEINE